MKILELFSGTGEFSKIAKEEGFSTFTVDNNRNVNSDLNKDILQLKLKDIPFQPDIIWASPPCIDYSHAKRKGVSYIELSNMLVIKTISLILALKPKYWIIENPQTGTLKFQYFMNDLPFTDVSYCRYGKTFRKQTRLWNNFKFVGRTCICKERHKDSCGNGRKEWTSKGLTNYEKGSIPKELTLNILKQIKEKELGLEDQE